MWLMKVAAIFKDDSLKGTAFHCELCSSFAKSNCFISDYDSLTAGISGFLVVSSSAELLNLLLKFVIILLIVFGCLLHIVVL